MKNRHDIFPKKGANPHDQTGHAAGVCPKCGENIPAKTGFRVTSLKCPKCGAAITKR